MKKRLIKEIAEKDRIAFKKHSAIRMRERNIRADEVKEVLINGEIIESYPDDRPLPSCLVMGYTEDEKPIHAVVAIDKDDKMLWVITVYSPNKEDWGNNFRRRKVI